MRWFGGFILILALFSAGPVLFLESWLGDLLFVLCLVFFVLGIVLMSRRPPQNEIDEGAPRKDLMGTALVAGTLFALIAGVLIFR